MKHFNGTIEFYRYVFTLIVCLMHLYYNFWGKGDLFGGGYISVDFFFMLSGYFLPSSCLKYSSSFKYTLMRYLGMAIIIVFACIIGVLLASKGQIDELPVMAAAAIPEMLCLQMSGIFYPQFVGVMWYISSMMIAGFFISNLYCYHGNKKIFVEMIGPAMILVGYAYVYHNTGNLDSVGKDQAGVLPLGTIRAFAGMSLGVILSHINVSFKRTTNDILQLLSLTGIFMLVLLQDHTKMDFLALFLCPVLLITAINRNSTLNVYTGKIGLKMSQILGRQFTLSMYIYSAMTYAILGIFIDFVSKGRAISAFIYIPVLAVISFIMCKISSKITPKLKLIFENDTKI